MELLRSSTQSNPAVIVRSVIRESTAPPASVPKIADTHTYTTDPQASRVQEVPTSTTVDDTRIRTRISTLRTTLETSFDEASYVDSNAGSGEKKSASRNSRHSVHCTSTSLGKPTYASVAASSPCTPEVVEKRTCVERLFTPHRFPSSQLGTSETPLDRLNETNNEPHNDDSRKLGEEGACKPVVLEMLAQELGISQETIRDLIKKLGAMI